MHAVRGLDRDGDCVEETTVGGIAARIGVSTNPEESAFSLP